MNTRVLLVLLPLGAAACMSVRPVLTPSNFIPQQNPDLVWVTSQQGEVIPLARPSLRGDTLVGNWLGTSERVTFSLPTLQGLSARQPDRKRTTMLIATAAALAGFVVWRALESGSTGSRCQYLTDNNEWICP